MRLIAKEAGLFPIVTRSFQVMVHGDEKKADLVFKHLRIDVLRNDNILGIIETDAGLSYVKLVDGIVAQFDCLDCIELERFVKKQATLIQALQTKIDELGGTTEVDGEREYTLEHKEHAEMIDEVEPDMDGIPKLADQADQEEPTQYRNADGSRTELKEPV